MGSTIQSFPLVALLVAAAASFPSLFSFQEFSLLLVSAGFAFAEQGMGMGQSKHMKMEHKMDLVKQVLMMADYLGLSNEQLEKLTELDIDSQINMIKDKAAIEVANLELKKLLRNYNADKTAIDTAIDKNTKRRT